MDKLVISILRSKNKREALAVVAERKQIMQSQIAKSTGLYASHLSRALRSLRDNKLVTCENPNDLNYKVYKITKLGLKVSKEVEEIVKGN